MKTSEDFWDSIAKSYDKTEKRLDKIFVRVKNNTKKYLKADDTVLDFGCGTGIISIEISGSVRKIIALDISSKMLSEAKKKSQSQKISNIDFIQSTIFDQRFTEQSFDVIIAFGILHLLENTQQVIQRLTDLLKTGGLLITSVPCLADKMSFITKLQFYPVFLASKIGVIPQTLKRYTTSEVKNLVISGNLQMVECEEIFHKLTACFIVVEKL